MGWTCNSNAGDKECMQNFSWEMLENTHLEDQNGDGIN